MTPVTNYKSNRLRTRLYTGAGPVIVLAIGSAVLASAQSSSPFATQKRQQAWETPQASEPSPVPRPQLRRGPQPYAAPAPTTPVQSPVNTMSPRAYRAPQTAQPNRQGPATQGPAAVIYDQGPVSQNSAARTADATPRIYTASPSTQPGVTYSQLYQGSDRSVNQPQSGPYLAGPAMSQPPYSPSGYSITAPQTGQAPTTSPSYTRPTSAGGARPDWNIFNNDNANEAFATNSASRSSSFQTRQTGGTYRSSQGLQASQGGAYGSSQTPWSSGSSVSSGSFQAQPQPMRRASLTNPPPSNISQNQQTYGQSQYNGYAGQSAAPSQNYGNSQAYAQGSQSPFARPPDSQPAYQHGTQPAPTSQAPGQDPTYGGPPPLSAQPPVKQSWMERLGLGNVLTRLRGAVLGGIGARDNDSWDETYIGDADIDFELSAITQNGLEYGFNVGARAQYDEGRKGFARRLPDCPPTLAGCASVDNGGTPTAVRGHSTQFYTDGPDIAKDKQIAIDSAYLFLRSAYGDVTIGRDGGAAYLFSLGAPSLLNSGASNTSVDYTALDSVKTMNDASGFGEKVTYTTPRLLGDRIGVGVQVGVSYALDPNVCGPDYCVEPDEIAGVLAPDLEDVMEVGVALDRTFANGLSVEGTFTYARASEVNDRDGFTDLESFGAGLEVNLADFTLGGSYLNSNQGLSIGDYESYDVGLTWKPSKLGVTLGYGHANDSVVGLVSDQYIAGLSWDLNDRFRLGGGVQYADRATRQDLGGVQAERVDEDSVGLFIEGGFRF